jgi:hypothetical protein
VRLPRQPGTVIDKDGAAIPNKVVLSEGKQLV